MVRSSRGGTSQAAQLVSVQTLDTLDALMLLAATCERDGYPLQAIHCLRALLKASLVPTMEARVRLNLGRLLLEHTCNCKDAQKELLRAQTLAQGLLGAVALKAEICCHLARYFQTQGQITYQVQMYEQALQMCEGGSASSEGASLLRWTALLHLLMAQAHAADGDSTKAHQAAHTGLAYCTQHVHPQRAALLDCHVLLQVFQAQLHLIREDEQGFGPACAAAMQLIDSLETTTTTAAAAAGSAAAGSPPGMSPRSMSSRGGATVSQPASLPPGFAAAAHLHVRLLQALHLLLTGQVDQLLTWAGPGFDQQGAGPAQHLQQLAQAAAAAQPATGCNWWPTAVITGLSSLISATLFMYRNKMAQALAQVDVGKQAVVELLAHQGIVLGEATESVMDPVTQLDCRCPLAVICQLEVVRANCLMATGDLPRAKQCIADVTSLVDRFPHQLHQLALVVHVLVAQYCYATCEYQAAARHLQAVKQNSAPGRTQLLASAMLAVTHLTSQPLADEAVQAAIDALEANTYAQHAQQHLQQAPGEQSQGASGMHALESVTCDLAVALIKLRMDQSADAKVILTQVLQSAHQKLNHFAVVSQAMLLVVPLLLRQGDAGGAEQLLTSSISLSRGQPAIQALVHSTVQQMDAGSPARKAGASLAGAAQKLATQVAAAAQHDPQQHTHLLSWGLMPVQQQ